MERLATLVPRPRLHLIRFHGVLAPNAKLRSKSVPAPAPPAPARISWARLLKRVFDVDVEHCPNCGGALKIIACPEPRRRAAIDDPPVNPHSSGPADPRPSAYPRASSRWIPNDLRSRSRLPTQADGAPRSEFDRASPQETFRLPHDRSPVEPTGTIVGFSSSKKGIDISSGRAIWLSHRKGRLKFLFMRPALDGGVGESSAYLARTVGAQGHMLWRARPAQTYVRGAHPRKPSLAARGDPRIRNRAIQSDFGIPGSWIG